MADIGSLLETHLVCQLENWSLWMGQFGFPLNMVPFFFFFNKKQQLYYSISGITLWHHLETSPSFLTLSPRVHPKWKKIKVNLDLSSFSGRRGVGLGSPFLLVPGGQRADPSCAHRTGLQPSTTERTFKQEQSRFCRGGGFGRVPREQVGSEWYFYTLIFIPN